MIPHRTRAIALDVIVLKRRSPSLCRLGRTRVGQGLCKDHDIPRIARYLDGSRRIQTRRFPLWIQVEIPLVRTWYDRETAIARVVLCEHRNHIDHRRSNDAVTNRILFIPYLTIRAVDMQLTFSV